MAFVLKANGEPVQSVGYRVRASLEPDSVVARDCSSASHMTQEPRWTWWIPLGQVRIEVVDPKRRNVWSFAIQVDHDLPTKVVDLDLSDETALPFTDSGRPR